MGRGGRGRREGAGRWGEQGEEERGKWEKERGIRKGVGR
jgi:hypothetical protein